VPTAPDEVLPFCAVVDVPLWVLVAPLCVDVEPF